MKIFLISGKAQHGKDTFARFFKEQQEQKGKKVLIAHYGDLVKYVCKTFFNWDGKKDLKGRSLLQLVGTNNIRKTFPDFWVGFIYDILTVFPDEWDYVLIPDVRFPNEIEYFNNGDGWDFQTVRITRPNFDNGLSIEQQQHISETALDNYKFDFYINNNSTLEDYNKIIEKMSEDYNW